MNWTKRQYIVQAYDELGYADFIFDLRPELLQRGLVRLDAMMGTWDGDGIKIGWPMPSTPTSSSLETVTYLADAVVEAVYTNLACRLAGSIGKTLSPDYKGHADDLYSSLCLTAAKNPPQVQLPETTPLGAGNKTYRGTTTFVTSPVVLATADNELDI